jgi:pimeloyl-ACP methyl ester carboxylesterase
MAEAPALPTFTRTRHRPSVWILAACAAILAPAVVTSQTAAAFAAPPHKTLRRVDRSLHFIMFDQPAAFAAALDDFLKP